MGLLPVGGPLGARSAASGPGQIGIGWRVVTGAVVTAVALLLHAVTEVVGTVAERIQAVLSLVGIIDVMGTADAVTQAIADRVDAVTALVIVAADMLGDAAAGRPQPVEFAAVEVAVAGVGVHRVEAAALLGQAAQIRPVTVGIVEIAIRQPVEGGTGPTHLLEAVGRISRHAVGTVHPLVEGRAHALQLLAGRLVDRPVSIARRVIAALEHGSQRGDLRLAQTTINGADEPVTDRLAPVRCGVVGGSIRGSIRGVVSRSVGVRSTVVRGPVIGRPSLCSGRGGRHAQDDQRGEGEQHGSTIHLQHLRPT